MCDQERDLVRRFLESWVRKENAEWPDLLSEEHVYYGVLETATRGVEGLREAQRVYQTVFPDLQIEIVHVFGGQGFGAARLRNRGTHLGDGWPVPPTGRRLEFHSHVHCRIQQGRIVETWEQWDRARVREQMGFVFDPLAKPA